MSLNYIKILLIILVGLVPLSSFLSENFSILYQLLFTVLSIIIILIFLYKGINLKYSFIKVLLFLTLFVFIINLITFDSINEIIKLPLIILLSTFSLIISRYLTIQKNINNKFLFMLSIYTLIVIIFFMIIDKINGVHYYAINTQLVTNGIAGNISKYAAILFPIIAILIYLEKYFFSFIQLILILITQRRSALLGEVIFIMINSLPYLFNVHIIKQNLKKIIISLFLVSIFSLFFIDQITTIFNSAFSRLDEVKEGSAGGRKVFWALAFDFYLSFDTINLFFGNPGALPQFLDQKFGLAIGAHTDILDFLCNYGAIGLILYLSIYISIFKYFWNYRKLAKKESVTGVSLIIAMFFLSITTGGFFYSLNLMYFIFTGYLVGVIELKKENNYE